MESKVEKYQWRSWDHKFIWQFSQLIELCSFDDIKRQLALKLITLIGFHYIFFLFLGAICEFQVRIFLGGIRSRLLHHASQRHLAERHLVQRQLVRIRLLRLAVVGPRQDVDDVHRRIGVLGHPHWQRQFRWQNKFMTFEDILVQFPFFQSFDCGNVFTARFY